MGVVWKSGIDPNVYDYPFEMNMICDWPVTKESSSELKIETPRVTYEIYGSGFKVDAYDFIDAGRITKIVETVNGQEVGSIVGIDISVKEALKVFQNPVALVPEFLAKHLSGSDVLLGSRDGDFLAGFAGDDKLSGRRGDDGLSGGAGTDTFIFAKRCGSDTIVDFDPKGRDSDVVDLSGFATIKNFAFLKNHLQRDKSDLYFEFGADRLTFEDVRKYELGKEDFIFA